MIILVVIDRIGIDPVVPLFIKRRGNEFHSADVVGVTVCPQNKVKMHDAGHLKVSDHIIYIYCIPAYIGVGV